MKRLFSLLLTVTTVFSIACIPARAAAQGADIKITGSDRVAGVMFGEKEETMHASIGLIRAGIERVDGRKAYKRGDGFNCFVTVNINDDYWYSTEPQRVKISVEYKDVENASFSVHYNSPTNGTWAYKGICETQGTDEWKIYEVYIDDFIPCNILQYGGGGNDIAIISNGWNSHQNGKVIIGSIIVEENVTEHKVEATASNGKTGRINSWGESDEITVGFKNFTQSRLAVSAEYEVTDNEGGRVSAGTISEFEIDGFETVNKTINTGARDCGTYILSLKTRSGSGTDVEEYSRDFFFSIVRTMEPGDKRFTPAAMNVHFDRSTSGFEQGVEIVSRIGISSTREGANWNDIEKSKGQYAFEARHKKMMDMLNDNGVGKLILAMNANNLYNRNTGDRSFLDDETEIKGYGELVKWVAQQADSGTEYIEILNEYNLRNFNSTGLGQDVYIKYLKAAYEAAKSVAPDIKIVAGGYAGYDTANIRRFLQLGGLKYCDAFSYHPYQSGDAVSVDKIKEQGELTHTMMHEYAGEIKPIILSEYGWSTATDHISSMSEKNRRNAIPIYYLYAYSHGYADVIYWYDLIQDGTNEFEREHNFGMLNFNSGENALTAKDSFVTFAAMTKLMQDAVPVVQVEDEENLVYAHEFKRGDGTNVAGLWTMKQSGRVSLDLGTSEIKVYDVYGTPMETLKSDTGIYTFDLSDEFVYIEGSFSKFETAEPVISVDGISSDVLALDNTLLHIYDSQKRALKLKAEYDEMVFKVECPETLADGAADIRVTSLSDKTGEYHIKLSLYDENGAYYTGKAKITVTDQKVFLNLTCEPFIEDNDRRWRVRTEITNLSHNNSIAGKCFISAPEDYKLEERVFANIEPEETRQINLNIPELLYKRPENITARVELIDGSIIETTYKLDFTSAVYTDTKPKIDGIKDIGEWDNASILVENRPDRFTWHSGKEYGGIEDCRLSFRMKWDTENLYMFIEVKDDVFSQKEIPSNMWNGDSIQIGILRMANTGIDDTDSTFTEMCFALIENGPAVFRHSSCGGKPVAEVTNFEGAIIRYNNETIYEMSIPWTELFDDEHIPKRGDKYGFSLLVNDNDGGSERHGWLNYNDGIGSVKDSKLFGNLNLR